MARIIKYTGSLLKMTWVGCVYDVVRTMGSEVHCHTFSQQVLNMQSMILAKVC